MSEWVSTAADALLQVDELAELQHPVAEDLFHYIFCKCKGKESEEIAKRFQGQKPALAKPPTSATLGAHHQRNPATQSPRPKTCKINRQLDKNPQIMGRLHSNGKGISASAIPYSRTPPAWLKVTPEQVVDQICKLAKKGATPSQIGVVLRDSHGVAQVKVVTGEFWILILIDELKAGWV